MQHELVKFIVVGGPRSGSTWMRLTLSSHLDIQMAGEILDDPHLREHPALAEDVWKGLQDMWRPSPEAKAKGFKMFYYHCWDYYLQHKYVWDMLRDDKTIKIVFLLRKNLLKLLTSWDLAFKTDIWETTADSPAPARPKLFLDPSTVVERLAEIDAGFTRLKDVFSGHDSHTVLYEDLFPDPDPHLHKIQQLLQVTPRKLNCTLLKLETRPLHDAIENYDEINKVVGQSRFADFLI